MSSIKVRRLPVARTRGTDYTPPSHAAPESHPRGKGFGGLSRIARIQTDPPAGYEPRHRRDVPEDFVEQATVAG